MSESVPTTITGPSGRIFDLSILLNGGLLMTRSELEEFQTDQDSPLSDDALTRRVLTILEKIEKKLK